WIPADMTPNQLKEAKSMAKKITDRLGGAGIFGVEFFVTREGVYFSELSPRPHDTGMVTMISQNLSEFDLHARAVLGLPIPEIEYYGPSASAVILADKEMESILAYEGVEKALSEKGTDIRLFSKPNARKYRRMGVALSRSKSTRQARNMAAKAASQITIR
ncbi:MAG: ATP-grasp domain-containing protein, partial [Bdellovibrionales bacterium]|nr:ATP-grasp domain-containing protein [Bdellovibrionales bacterium]